MRKVIAPELPTRYDEATKTRIPSIDLSPARAWGSLVVLVESRTRHETDCQLIKDFVNTRMSPDDYILATGDVIFVAAAMAWANEKFGFVTLLRWDKNEKQYREVEVRL